VVLVWAVTVLHFLPFGLQRDSVPSVNLQINEETKAENTPTCPHPLQVLGNSFIGSLKVCRETLNCYHFSVARTSYRTATLFTEVTAYREKKKDIEKTHTILQIILHDF
jgi:hypothetical protein